MKASMKTMKMVALALFAGAFIGCAGEGNTKQEIDNEAVKAETHEVHEDHSEHAHYACPMHPEITGHEGDKCSKCGMDLTEIEPE